MIYNNISQKYQILRKKWDKFFLAFLVPGSEKTGYLLSNLAIFSIFFKFKDCFTGINPTNFTGNDKPKNIYLSWLKFLNSDAFKMQKISKNKHIFVYIFCFFKFLTLNECFKMVRISKTNQDLWIITIINRLKLVISNLIGISC